MGEWNPQQYLKFRNERTQPSIDLALRISLLNPETIIDIGCGPGNSTQVLHNRWPLADIIGIDNSKKMIEKAGADYPDQKWEIMDAMNLNPNQIYDIVFSNATLQWIPGHETLIPRLFSLVKQNGVLAVQMPANNEAPFYRIMIETGKSDKWSRFTTGSEEQLTFHPPEYYYNILSSLTRSIDLWVTTYYHIMQSHRDITEWHKSTGMKPYLESLPDDRHRAEFEAEIINKCEEAYPVQKDGKVLYLFKRVFFIAGKV
jgi:trans-aconitate 2-methyltransferase